MVPSSGRKYRRFGALLERASACLGHPAASVAVEATVDFLLSKRDPDAAKRFFRKMLKDEPLLSPEKIGTDGANTFRTTIKTAVDDGLLQSDPVHYVTKHLQQGIESDHFRVKKNMPKIGGFQTFNTARRTIAGFEAMLWLRKGFGFTAGWTQRSERFPRASLRTSKR